MGVVRTAIAQAVAVLEKIVLVVAVLQNFAQLVVLVSNHLRARINQRD